MPSLQQHLAARLAERREAALYRRRRTLSSPQQVTPRVDGQLLLSFCSNDYLGLANHPDIIKGFTHAAAQFGVGSGASHLVSGHSHHHHALEEELAEFTGRSRALVFSSGYMANAGILTALAGKRDRVFEDRLNHASLIDGGLFCGARFRRYGHLDVAALEALLEKKEQSVEGMDFVVTDGVFSMDGDAAPLDALVALARRRAAVLMMDDAHGFGTLGRTGGGLAQLTGEKTVIDEHNLPILVGTFGKAFGTAGAFVAGSEELIESLIQFCRPYIYTTALPPAVAAATRVSLKLVAAESWRREKLQDLIERFRTGCGQLGFKLTASQTPIQALVLGSAQRALAVSAALEERGMLVTAIRPPTVPAGTARLRITFSASHEERHVDRLLAGLETACSAGGGE